MATQGDQTVVEETVQEVVTQQPHGNVASSSPTIITTGGGNQAPSVGLAYVLWFFLGIIGVHHLYIGRGVGIWLLSLITFQGLGIWWLIDLFLIPSACSKAGGNQTIIIS